MATYAQYKREQERAEDDALKSLDAYGHLSYCVGFSPESDGVTDDDRGDWLACFDFVVFEAVGCIHVSYHVVVDSDSAGFIDTIETNTVSPHKAPFGLPDYWTSIGSDQVTWTDSELKEAHATNERWNAALLLAISEAIANANG